MTDFLRLPSKHLYLTVAGWLWLFVGGLMVGLGIAKNINLLTLLAIVLAIGLVVDDLPRETAEGGATVADLIAHGAIEDEGRAHEHVILSPDTGLLGWR